MIDRFRNMRRRWKVLIGCASLPFLCFCGLFTFIVADNGVRQAGLLPTYTPNLTLTAQPSKTPPPTKTNAPTDIPSPTSEPTVRPTSTPDVGSSVEAEFACEDFVTDRLKSPSTADFGGFLDDWDSAQFVSAEDAEAIGIYPSDFDLESR